MPTGILLANKPAGLTSHDVVAKARKALNEKKSGHAGTLDPQATGLLVLAFGDATRWLPYLPGDKRYIARVRFGVETDTEDIWGRELKRQDASKLSQDEIRETLLALKNETTQVPPMVSALKHEGKRLYEYARDGIEIERKARPLEIFELKVLSVQGEEAEFELHCGSGTYVRSLCAEAGRKLGVGACMSALQRTAVGPFRVENAVPLEAMSEAALLGPEKALAHLEAVTLDAEGEMYVSAGRDVSVKGPYDSTKAYRLNAGNGTLFGLATPRQQAGRWFMHPERVFVKA